MQSEMLKEKQDLTATEQCVRNNKQTEREVGPKKERKC